MPNDKQLTLKKLQDYPIRTSVGSLLAIVAAVWAFYRPFLIEDLSADFVTKAELTKQMAVVTGQLSMMQKGQDVQKIVVGTLSTQVNVGVAFQIERSFQDNLDKHEAEKPTPPTRYWLETQRDLKAKRDLASKYKNCVLNEKKNCDQLQKQLWQ